jgi:hypothetical protein
MPGIMGDNKKLMVLEGYKSYFEKYKMLDPGYSKIYKVTPAKGGDGYKETMHLGPGKPSERTNENDKITFRSPVQAWTAQVKYREYTDGISLGKRIQQNNVKVKNLMKKYCALWADKSLQEKEGVAATVFNEGGDTSGNSVFDGSFTDNADASGDLLYDSKPMFNLTGNARRIYSQTTGTYYNAVTGLSLTPTNFETIYDLVTVTNAVDERGDKIDFPADTLLTESGAQHRIARRIVETDGLPFSQNNDINPYKGIVTAMSWRYLDDNSAFYIGKRQHDDFQFHQRQVPEIRYFRNEETLGYCASFNEEYGIFIKNFRVWGRGGGTYA